MIKNTNNHFRSKTNKIDKDMQNSEFLFLIFYHDIFDLKLVCF